MRHCEGLSRSHLGREVEADSESPCRHRGEELWVTHRLRRKSSVPDERVAALAPGGLQALEGVRDERWQPELLDEKQHPLKHARQPRGFRKKRNDGQSDTAA